MLERFCIAFMLGSVTALEAIASLIALVLATGFGFLGVISGGLGIIYLNLDYLPAVSFFFSCALLATMVLLLIDSKYSPFTLAKKHLKMLQAELRAMRTKNPFIGGTSRTQTAPGRS